MDRIIKSKRGLEPVTSCSSGYEQNQKYSFICYILFDQVWWSNVKRFLSYSKHYICKFMQVNWWHHKLFHFDLSLWICKLWKGREKIQKLEYLKNEKSFLHEIKNIFHSFWRAIIWCKNKNLIKIADTSFKDDFSFHVIYQWKHHQPMLFQVHCELIFLILWNNVNWTFKLFDI